jgi:hypothetical protein
MSEEDNETEYLPPIKEVMDPIEKMVRNWVIKNVKDELDGEFEGVNLSFQDLGTLILSCFDEVQQIMLESIIPEGTTIH